MIPTLAHRTLSSCSQFVCKLMKLFLKHLEFNFQFHVLLSRLSSFSVEPPPPALLENTRSKLLFQASKLSEEMVIGSTKPMINCRRENRMGRS